MSSTIGGTITALLGLLPTFVHVSSSTNATPIAVTTSAPHGAETGDTVVIDAHLINTAANGSWEVIVTSTTTLLLIGSTGNGVGGATGTLRCASFGSDVTIPSVGDPRQISGINVALEGLADRSALLLYLLNFSQQVYAGGATTVHEDAKVVFNAGAVLFGVSGSSIEGTFMLGDGTNPNQGTLEIAEFSRIAMQSGSLLDVQDGAGISILGDLALGSAATFESDTKLEVTANGSIVLDSGAHLDVHGGAALNFTGTTSQVTGTCLFSSWNAAAGSSLTFNGSGAANALVLNNTAFALNSSSTVADAASTTKSGPVVHSGANGYVGGRDRYISSNATGIETINASSYEVLTHGTTQSGDVHWKLNDPPNGERVFVTCDFFAARANGHGIDVSDSSSDIVYTYGGSGNEWVDLRWSNTSSTWIVIRKGPLP